jgi:rhodanese-related sulfurtransferase
MFKGWKGYFSDDREPDTKIVLYCRTGGRSALGTLTLQDMGYTNVVDLNGGFKEWASVSKPA